MLRLALVFTLLATLAHAGAWPRAKGRWFTATATEFSGLRPAEDLSVFNSFYMEYGLTQSLTLGLDVGHAPGAQPDVRLFLRLPVLKRGQRRLAIEASSGLAGGMVGGLGYSALGLSYGQGFQLAGRNGWLALDTRIVQGHGSDGAALQQGKLDVTVGVTHHNGMQSMAQLFHTQAGENAYTTFAPSVVVPLGRRTKIQTGLLVDLNNRAPPGLKLGLWQEF